MDFLEQRYRKDESVVSRKIADEVILVPIRKNVGDLESIYTLDEVGARIWELIDGIRSLADIKEILLSEFDVAGERLISDMENFIRQVESIGGIKAIVNKE